MEQKPLDGGIANAGNVVRVGPHVLRPSNPYTGSIHAFLRAVTYAGFEGAPTPVVIDEDGRERLVFIDGEVPVGRCCVARPVGRPMRTERGVRSRARAPRTRWRLAATVWLRLPVRNGRGEHSAGTQVR